MTRSKYAHAWLWLLLLTLIMARQAASFHGNIMLKKRADTEVQIEGYMIALQPTQKFSQFLLVPFPPSCPYCVPAGPNQIIQMHMRSPVSYSAGLIAVRGVLTLNDELSSLFYSMEDAEIVTQ